MILRTIVIAAIAMGTALIGAQSSIAQDKDHRPMTAPSKPLGQSMDRDDQKMDRDDRNQAQAPNKSQRLNPNSNGINGLDRDKGRDRAEDRAPTKGDQDNRTYKQ